MARIIPTVKDYVLNQTLIDQIDEGLNSKICYIKSPSGYGKTSLLAKWLEDKNFKDIYWYSLRKIDSVPLVFYRNFIGGIEKMLNRPDFTSLYKSFLESVITSEEISIIAGAIGNQELTFVLDDFHNVSYEVLNLIKAFIINTGYKIRFLIASRDDIPNEFSDMLIRQEISFIENGFAFGFKETKEFFESRGINLSDSAINNIISYTHGWVPAYVSIAFCIEQSNKDEVEFNNKYLFGYIKQTIWDDYDSNTKNLLRLASINNGEISVDMASKILEIEKSMLIDTINKCDSFLIKKSERKYILSHIMNDFVKTELNEALRKKLCTKTARYFYDKKKDTAAILFYYEAGEYKEIVKPLKRLGYDNKYINYDSVMDVLYKLPNYFVFKSPTIIMAIIVDAFNRFDLDTVSFYIEKLNALDQLSDSKYLEEVDKIQKYLVLYNLNRTNKDILEKIMLLSQKKKLKAIDTVNPCYIFPSVLRGLRDFSDIYNSVLMYPEAKTDLMKLFGSFGTYLYELGIAEAKLEMGQPNEAVLLASNIIFSDSKNVPIEIYFTGVCIMTRGLIALNTPDKVLNPLMTLKRRIMESENLNLLPNYRALSSKYYYAIGENNIISEWLLNHANIDLELATFRDYYIIKSKVKILFLKGDYTECLNIINFLIKNCTEYKRIVDLGEYYYMKASICDYLDDFERCKEYINKSLDILKPLGYKLVYYEYGMIGIKTLEKALEYLDLDKKAYVQAILAKRNLYIHENRDNIIISDDVKELTNTELKILRLIDKAYSNEQICAELDIKISTVKTHISNMFSKLGVKNRLQAVKIAKDLDVI